VEELPILGKLADESGDRLVVLGVNYKESSWTVDEFTRAHAVRYPVLMDKTGEQFRRWTSGVMPTTVLIGRDGTPRWRLTGAIDAGDRQFRDAVTRLLAQ